MCQVLVTGPAFAVPAATLQPQQPPVLPALPEPPGPHTRRPERAGHGRSDGNRGGGQPPPRQGLTADSARAKAAQRRQRPVSTGPGPGLRPGAGAATRSYGLALMGRQQHLPPQPPHHHSPLRTAHAPPGPSRSAPDSAAANQRRPCPSSCPWPRPTQSVRPPTLAPPPDPARCGTTALGPASGLGPAPDLGPMLWPRPGPGGRRRGQRCFSPVVSRAAFPCRPEPCPGPRSPADLSRVPGRVPLPI